MDINLVVGDAVVVC